MLTTRDQIEQEILRFYLNLLGTCSNVLKGVNVPVIRDGARLNDQQRRVLITPVSNQEIDDALMGINFDSAPGLDGMTSYFFHKSWECIKSNIYI